MEERYLRTILSFFGISDFQCVAAENLDKVESDVEGIVNEAINKAVSIAKEF